MKSLIRLIALMLLLATAWFGLNGDGLVAQDEEGEAILKEFEPTEKLPADAAVSFPVDI